VVWSDGEWDALDSYWKSTEFLAWLYNDSPVKETVVVNDRWGYGTACKHGDFVNCADRYRPGKLQSKKWENAMTIDRNSWGYVRRSQLNAYYSIRELILELVQTIAYGGNILINVGPTADGRIIPIFEERLRQMGSWLSIAGPAIYETTPWLKAQNDTTTANVYYTKAKKSDDVYSIFFDWPDDGKLILGSVTTNTTVFLLGKDHSDRLPTRTGPGSELIIDLSSIRPTGQPAWVLRLADLK
jgi:alpha-L-fucosidase